MIYNLIITDKASADIDDIAAFIFQASASLDLTRNFINKIYDKIETLGTFPNSGSNPRSRALLSEEYKFIVYEQYLIFYKFVDDVVYISSVFNSKKDYFRYYTF